MMQKEDKLELLVERDAVASTSYSGCHVRCSCTLVNALLCFSCCYNILSWLAVGIAMHFLVKIFYLFVSVFKSAMRTKMV